LHVAFTNRLFGTFSTGDGRYHAHVILLGFPTLISTVGIVEAPAKPREFYLLKQRYAGLGLQVPLEAIKERFRGRFIDYDDPRLTEVMKGYVLQAVFYYLLGEPFCESKSCRLYNARWQEEVLSAQLDGRLCERHEGMLRNLREALGATSGAPR